MKKLIIAATAVFFLISAGRAYAGPDDEIVHIPDSVFKHYLIYYQEIWQGMSRIDKNRDGEIQVSEAAEYNSKLILGSYGYNITSLEGIRAFTSLEEINIHTDIEFIDLENMESLREVTIEADIDSVSVAGCKKLEEFTMRRSNCKKINIQGCSKLDYFGAKCNNKLLNEIEGLQENSSITRLAIYNSNISNAYIENFEHLYTLGLINNEIQKCILSDMKHLILCNAGGSSLTELNMQTGYNTDMERVQITNCPNLYCIQVDDPEYSEAMWRNGDTTKFKFDEHLFFSTDCKSCIREMRQTQFAIYPNPAGEYLYIATKSEKILPYEIIDIKGEAVQSGELVQTRGVTKIDLSLLVKGTYFVRIGESTKKFLKE